MEVQDNDKDAYNSTKPSKFRLKSKHKSSRHSKRSHYDEDEDDRSDQGRSRKRHGSSDRHRSSHRHSKRRREHTSSRTGDDYHFERHGGYDDPESRHRESLYDDPSGLDPEAAFRESLFDALADDEGADYWASVYGQPIHVYPNTKPGPNGELEKMTDEEYAEYVRSKMWEKSHQHIIEEREARERARKKNKDQKHKLEEVARKHEEEREHIRRSMQESLQRGEERKRAKQAEASWKSYLERWDALKQRRDLAQEDARELIPWPVVSGKRRHVSKDAIEYFFENSGAWKDDPVSMLKAERVRWHPDKMQQRFGQHIDDETMKSATAVFQVVDRLWGEQAKR